MKTKLYVVITTCQPCGEDEYISDIILITDNKNKAQRVVDKMEAHRLKHPHKPVKGLDYSILMDWDAVTYIQKDLNKIAPE